MKQYLSILSILCLSGHLALAQTQLATPRPVILDSGQASTVNDESTKRRDHSEHAFLDHLKDCTPYTRDLGHLGMSIIKGWQDSRCEVLFVSNDRIHNCQFPSPVLDRLTSDDMYAKADEFKQGDESASTLKYYADNYCRTKVLPQSARNIAASQAILDLDDREGNVKNICLKMYYQILYAFDKPSLDDFTAKLGPGRELGKLETYNWQTPDFMFSADVTDGKVIAHNYDVKPIPNTPAYAPLLKASTSTKLEEIIASLGSTYEKTEQNVYAWTCEGNLPMAISFHSDGRFDKLFPMTQ